MDELSFDVVRLSLEQELSDAVEVASKVLGVLDRGDNALLLQSLSRGPSDGHARCGAEPGTNSGVSNVTKNDIYALTGTLL